VLESGYTITRAERSPELTSVSVPVSEPHGPLLGAIQITGILSRQTEEQQIRAAAAAVRQLKAHGFASRPASFPGKEIS
jgi:DNA-binding IclR family transcriptional regulator